VAGLRRLCIAVVVLGALAGFASHRALAAPPLPACPATGGTNQLASAHFIVRYDGDKSLADYVTETQAGDILAAAERAYAAYAAMGFPAPLVDPGAGKTVFVIMDLSPWSLASIYCSGSQYFDSGDVGTEDTPYSVGFDVFAQIAQGVAPGIPAAWLIQGVNAWASWNALGYPAASAGGLGPYEMSLDCFDPNGKDACSKTFYEGWGQSRWAFYEYLAERFGQSFILELLNDANTAGDQMVGLQNALAAHGTNVSDAYAAYTTKLMAGGWTAAALNIATPPTSGSVIETGAATGDTPPQTLGVDHLATRYIEIDRGDGDASHACYAATLTIHVTIPAGVTSQPTFYWNGSASSPVPLTVNGTSATATVPWDTCAWSNKGLLSLPNTSLAANGTNFQVWTHIDVDTKTPATATPPPAPASIYGQVIDTGSVIAVPDIVVVGPQLLRLAANATDVHVVVQSSAEGQMTVTLGTLDLGTVYLRPGMNDLHFKLAKSQVATLRTSSGTNTLTLTPSSPDLKATGTVATQKVAFTPVKKTVVKHKKKKPAHKK
jgi:hypothetical protein